MVLVSVLFLVHINDFLSHVDCSVGLFVNDNLIYQMVESKTDGERLQANLDSPNTWAEIWEMSFDANKYNIIASQPSGRLHYG